MLYTKFLHNKLLTVLNNLTDFNFNFDGEEYYNITVDGYRPSCAKDTNDNLICLNKHQMKDAVSFLRLNCYSLLVLRFSYYI